MGWPGHAEYRPTWNHSREAQRWRSSKAHARHNKRRFRIRQAYAAGATVAELARRFRRYTGARSTGLSHALR